jgi:glycosyltransferase involved in cell wall biosynthesis
MISVFSPVHKLNKIFLVRAYNSLRNQTYQDWEWVVMLNGEAVDGEGFFDQFKDSRVKVFKTSITNNIGNLKALCCNSALGEIYVELDYDDELAPTCLEVINDTFRDENIRYLYSNCFELRNDGTCNVYGAQYGWKYKEHTNGWKELVAFPEQVQYMRRIEWAPNHVRAFRAEAYHTVGGYNVNTEVGDDHELICKFYLEFGEKGFKHIDEPLYIQYLHGENTHGGNNRNSDIQKQVDLNYCTYVEGMFLKWAKDNWLEAYDLGGRFNCPDGYKSVDLYDADIICDLNNSWDIKDDSVGVLRVYHVLEHLKDPIHFFNEAYRVLADGGLLLIEVPSTNGMGAFSDPTHVSYFNPLSFEYYTNENYARFIRAGKEGEGNREMYKGRFQKSRVVEYWWDNPRIPIISAQLIALKGGDYDKRWCGEKLI